MAIDYTKLLKKISPQEDGEDTLRLRVGTVLTANANGTVDITMSSGVIVPGVPKLTTAYAPVGAVVQMISFRGSLMVIGGVGNGANGNFPIPIRQRGIDSITIPVGSTFVTKAVLFPIPYPVGIVPDVFTNYTGTQIGALGFDTRSINVTNTGFEMHMSRFDAVTAGNGFTGAFIWNAFVDAV